MTDSASDTDHEKLQNVIDRHERILLGNNGNVRDSVVFQLTNLVDEVKSFKSAVTTAKKAAITAAVVALINIVVQFAWVPGRTYDTGKFEAKAASGQLDRGTSRTGDLYKGRHRDS